MEFKGHPDQHFGHLTYSQHGEDLMLVNLFKLMGIEKPSYLDIGAHHPINISNTALLYSRGSRGVNVEANPNLIQAFHEMRPEDINVQIGVGPHRERKFFLMFDPQSGRNTFSEDEAASAEKLMGRGIKEQMELEIVTLDDIVNAHCGGLYPDLLTIDVEGLDYAILREASLHRTGPKIICVEVRRNFTAEFERVLVRRGYYTYCRMGENLIFVAREYMSFLR